MGDSGEYDVMTDPLPALRERRNDLIARLIRGARLIAAAEERGQLERAGRLAGHWRRLALELAACQRRVREERGRT